MLRDSLSMAHVSWIMAHGQGVTHRHSIAARCHLLPLAVTWSPAVAPLRLNVFLPYWPIVLDSLLLIMFCFYLQASRKPADVAATLQPPTRAVASEE